MSALDHFKKVFQKVTTKKGEQWLEQAPAWTGDYAGVVDTGKPGFINVRVDAQVVTMFNGIAPMEPDIPVMVGRHKDQPQLWQVISRREVWSETASPSIMHHAAQHAFMAPDMVVLDRRQILALSVMTLPSRGPFYVRVYGDIRLTPLGNKLISTQAMNLASYVPATGSKYVNIESDTSGVLSVHDDEGMGFSGVATPANIPVPDAGKYIRAHVFLYAEQAALTDDDIIVPMPVDFNPADVSSAAHNHDTRYPRKWIGKTTAPTATDDSGDGYGVDDLWIDEVHDKAYVALDVAVGAALWQEVGGGSGGAIIVDDLTSQIPAASDHFDLAVEASGTVLLFFNGVYQSPDFFTMDMDNLGLTTDFSPISGDTLVAVHGTGDFFTLTDSAAVHVNVAGEITGLTEKTTPVAGDYLLLEDNEDGGSKKKVDVDNVGGGWEQVLDEDGSSIANWTSGGGTWSSDGTIIQQTNTSQAWRTLKFNDLIDSAAGIVFEAEIRIQTYASGQFHIGGLVVGYSGAVGSGGASVDLRFDNNTEKMDFGGWSVASLYSLTFDWGNVDEWHTLRVVSAGGFISAYVDGVLKGTAGNTPARAGDARYIGLIAYTAADFRNIKAWKMKLP